MRKTLLLAAALLGFATASAGTIVGAEDNSGEFWSAWSETEVLTGNGSIHFDFTNYSNKEQNWCNWVLVLVDGDYNPVNEGYSSERELVAIRADKYGWGTLFNGENQEINWEDWDAWRENQDGAYVQINVVREGETVTVTAITTGADYTVYKYVTVVENVTPESIGAFLTVEKAHLDIDSAYVTEAPVAAAYKIDDLVGDHNFVWNFWDCGYYVEDPDAVENYSTYYSNADWMISIELDPEVENGIILKNMPWNCTGIYGVCDPEAGKITFDAQRVYVGESAFWFCQDNDYLWATQQDTEAMEPVVAIVDAEGTIHFDGWNLCYIYEEGEWAGWVWLYLWDNTCKIAAVENANGLQNSVIDNANGAVEYYNLQGMRMSGDNLPAGIYVKRQGNKTSKMMVK